MLTVWMMDRMGYGPISLYYSEDNKKNTFNNHGNNGHVLKMLRVNRPLQQECIRVGCVPPAHWPYLVVSYACPPRKNHACPPGKNHACPPGKNHACPPGKKPHMPPPGKTTHAPQEKPCTPPQQKPHTPPEQPRMTPPKSNHTRPPVNRITDACENITFAKYVCGR